MATKTTTVKIDLDAGTEKYMEEDIVLQDIEENDISASVDLLDLATTLTELKAAINNLSTRITILEGKQ